MSNNGDNGQPLYSARPEWADVKPVPQDDGPNPLVPIAYPPDYADAMSYFRAILATSERSERVLELTATIIGLNPGHYTAWKYRQDTVLALSSNLHAELEFVENMAEENPKSYQIWHYRQAIVDRLGDASREVSFVNRMLAIDSKNYHAWGYRQWVVKKYGFWDGELRDVDRLLEADVRNNSVWNQRFWVMENGPEAFSTEKMDQEIAYAAQRIAQAPRNESPWMYIRGIVRLAGKTLAKVPAINDLCSSFEAQDTIVPHALAMQLDAACERKDVSATKAICEQLAEHDPTRAKYWAYRATAVA
ncbi:protein farnesyltransferase [Geranomyces variabilis]|nr:protein farnesyltransferase [Geranomyces variabilis]KAJ3137705.1 hypothetical protein HDU90_001655 [Geranomyces variabilis]